MTTLEIERRVLGPKHPDTLVSMNNLACVLLDEGKYAQAEALYSQALEIERRVLGPEHPDTLISMNNLAHVYWYEGKYPQAEALDSKRCRSNAACWVPSIPTRFGPWAIWLTPTDSG